MKKQGVGYAVIQPKFSSSEQLDLYHKVMRDEHADLSAYMDKPYLTKQEALALKEILEVGIPVLFETYKIPYGGIASIVAAAVNRNRILKDKIVTEEVETQNGSRLEFKIQEHSAETQGQGAGTETSGVGDAGFLNSPDIYRALRAMVGIGSMDVPLPTAAGFFVDILAPQGVRLRVTLGITAPVSQSVAAFTQESAENTATLAVARSEAREEAVLLDVLPEGAEVSGRVQFASHKKAPGTAAFTNAEEIFYSARSKEMKTKTTAEKDGFSQSEIFSMPDEVSQRISKVFPLSSEAKNALRWKKGKDGRKKEPQREPATFREQIYALMKAGVFQIQVDDMGAESIEAIKKRAETFNMRNIQIDTSSDKEIKVSQMLYPRFGAHRNPMGAMSFLTIEELDVPVLDRDGKMVMGKDKKPKTKKEWKALIHITKAMWDTIYDRTPSKDHPQGNIRPGRDYFLSQLVMHEIIEGFLAPQEQVTNHRMANILEIDLASPGARLKGISDINQWYLDHGTPTYLAMLEETYRIDEDTTMGAFSEELWKIAHSRDDLALSRTRDTPKWEQKLVGDHTVKRAYNAPPLTEDQKTWLEHRYIGVRKGTMVKVPNDVRKWISAHSFGPHFDRLVKLTDPKDKSIDKNDKIVFTVDDDSELEGHNTYQLPEYMGERRPGILFFLTQEKDERGRAAGPVEIHMTATAWDKVWTNPSWNKERPAFLAQVLVYAYIQNYLPSDIEGLGRESWANLSALQFASTDGKNSWLNDLNLFFLDTAVEERNINYLYDIAWNYELMRDTQGNFRRAIFDRFNEIWENGRNRDFFIDAVETIEDLAVYYTFLHEEVYSNKPLTDRLLYVARDLEAAAVRNDFIKEQLSDKNNQFLFKVRIDKTGKYVPNEEYLTMNEKVIKRRRITTRYVLQSVFNFLQRDFELETVERFELSNQNVLELKALKKQLDEQRNRRNEINRA
ncbi:MAG: hypothetical protein WCT39_06595, partial [Candidatus Margulisiibacteriota bacterium]